MKKLLAGIVSIAAVITVMASTVPAQADIIVYPPGPSVPTTAQQ